MRGRPSKESQSFWGSKAVPTLENGSMATGRQSTRHSQACSATWRCSGTPPRDFVPSVTGEMPEPSHAPKATAPAPSCTACKKLMAKEKELQKALKDLDRMRLELAKRDGMVEALERQLNRRESAEQAGRRLRTKGALQGDTVRGSEEAPASRRQLAVNTPKKVPAFEDIKHVNEYGAECWSARELYPLLGYSTWQKFAGVIEKAMQACENSKQKPSDHFNHTVNLITAGKGAERQIEDYELSRYACYLIVQNGDPSKPVIAYGQTYFAIQTRRQELQDDAEFMALSEDKKRLALRKEIAEHNKDLAAAAKDSGVETNIDYAIFQNHGYKGLYGGLDAKMIHERKGLKKSQKILDHMGSTELAANIFRATQTEEKLRMDNVYWKINAYITHYEVWKKVRQTIEDLGGTMPEDPPTNEKSIKQLEREERKQLQDCSKSKKKAKSQDE